MRIATGQTVRDREISLLKKESSTLRRQLDKANLDRIKEIELGRNSIETQAGQFSQEKEFKEFRLKSAREMAKLRDETASLRSQLTHLTADQTRSIQPKALLSPAKKLRGLTRPASPNQKNKTAGIHDKQDRVKDIARKKLLPPSKKINQEDVIKSKLLHWENAWESRNIPLYLSFYSKNFRDQKRSRSKWEAYRRSSLENGFNIRIQISNIKIYIHRNSVIRSTFLQRYKSNKISDTGLKELTWKKGADGWKIIKETWKPQ